MSPKPKAWLARSGRFSERETWALETDVTPGGFGEVADLSECQSRELPEEIRADLSLKQIWIAVEDEQ